MLANRFHAGTNQALQRFMAIAAEYGFEVDGDTQQMELKVPALTVALRAEGPGPT
jgi:hypothetical protein